VEKQHNKELHNLYCSPIIIRIINLRQTRWTEHVACMGRQEMHTKFLLESLKGNYSEDLGVDARFSEMDLSKIELEGVY
jgi:hypothetical protein